MVKKKRKIILKSGIWKEFQALRWLSLESAVLRNYPLFLDNLHHGHTKCTLNVPLFVKSVDSLLKLPVIQSGWLIGSPQEVVNHSIFLSLEKTSQSFD